MPEPVRIIGGLTEDGIQARVRSDGSLVTAEEGWVLSDLDTSGTTKYFGYVDKDGRWKITELTATTMRYLTGTEFYTVYWANRATNSYDYYHNIF